MEYNVHLNFAIKLVFDFFLFPPPLVFDFYKKILESHWHLACGPQP